MTKNRNLISLLIAVVLTCSNFQCDDDEPDAFVTIVNNTNEDVLYNFIWNLPEDTLLQIPTPFPNEDYIKISLVEADGMSVWSTSLQSIKNEEKDGNILRLFLFSKDSIEQIPWEEIRNNYLILKRYDLTLADLEANNWTIEYP